MHYAGAKELERNGGNHAGRAKSSNGSRGDDGEGQACVSQEALDYVMRDPVVRQLPGTEKFLMRQIAMLHDPRVNCAYANNTFLADQIMTTPRNIRRLVTSLEKKGLLERRAVERENGSQTSNEYELPGMRLGTAVTLQVRQQVFRTPRIRRASQLSLLLSDDAGTLTTNGSDGLAVAEDSAVGSIDLAVLAEQEAAVEIGELCPGGEDNSRPGGGGQQSSSLDVLLDVLSEVKLPLPLLSIHSGGKTSNGKSADQEQEQKATASAKAKATTSALEAAEVSTESVGEIGMSSGPGFRVGGNVIPFGRGRRDVDPRAALDGEEAALYDETMCVLGMCGIAAKNATRKQRLAVTEALRAHVQLNPGCSMREAGKLAVAGWDAYLEAASSGLLWRVVGVRQFFAEGYWLENGHPWDWNHAAIAERKRGAEARIGVR